MFYSDKSKNIYFLHDLLYKHICLTLYTFVWGFKRLCSFCFFFYCPLSIIYPMGVSIVNNNVAGLCWYDNLMLNEITDCNRRCKPRHTVAYKRTLKRHYEVHEILRCTILYAIMFVGARFVHVPRFLILEALVKVNVWFIAHCQWQCLS